jgi:hypothetical protein
MRVGVEADRHLYLSNLEETLMKRLSTLRSSAMTGTSLGLAALSALLAWACSGSNSGGETPDAGEDAPHDAARDTSKIDGAAPDAGGDRSAPDGTSEASPDSGGDTGPEDGSTGDSSDGACPAAWLIAPAVDASIAVPDGGGGVLLHAAGAGTQNYTCDAVPMDGGTTTYAWTFVGPQADLNDCHATLIGHHFASDGGATAPEWQTLDGTYVIGHKLDAFIPDGGADSVPWLLLHATAHGGTGTLASADYIQRLNTDGGIAPEASSCTVSATGTTVKVPYSADYFFFGE